MKLRLFVPFFLGLILATACGENEPSATGASAPAEAAASGDETPVIYAQAPPVAMKAPIRKGDVSGTSQVGEWTLGPELAPGESAVSDTILEAFHKGSYSGSEGTTVTLVRTAEEPGRKAGGDFALKVIREQPGDAGVLSGDTKVFVRAGHRYLVRCRIDAGIQAGKFRMGMAGPDGAPVWAKNIDGADLFDAPAGEWTQLAGVLEVSGGQDIHAELRIQRQGGTPEAWYLDDVSVREIIESQRP